MFNILFSKVLNSVFTFEVKVFKSNNNACTSFFISEKDFNLILDKTTKYLPCLFENEKYDIYLAGTNDGILSVNNCLSMIKSKNYESPIINIVESNTREAINIIIEKFKNDLIKNKDNFHKTTVEQFLTSYVNEKNINILDKCFERGEISISLSRGSPISFGKTGSENDSLFITFANEYYKYYSHNFNMSDISKLYIRIVINIFFEYNIPQLPKYNS